MSRGRQNLGRGVTEYSTTHTLAPLTRTVHDHVTHDPTVFCRDVLIEQAKLVCLLDVLNVDQHTAPPAGGSSFYLLCVDQRTRRRSQGYLEGHEVHVAVHGSSSVIPVSPHAGALFITFWFVLGG